MFNFWWSAWLVDGLEPHPPPLSSQNNKMLIFWIMFNFWWLAGLVDGLEPCLPPLSSQKYKMLIFGLHSTSDDRPGWLMDSNPICHPSPAKKIKCLFLDYVQLLMIGQVIRLTNGDWNAKKGPLSHHKMKCLFLDYVQLLIIGWVIWAMKVKLKCDKRPPKSSNIEMLIFGLHSTSDDWPSDPSDEIWSKCKKMKCFLVRVFCWFS